MTPKKGMRFYHSRVLDSIKFDGKSPQLYQVTRVAAGMAYYRPVYDYESREELGKADCCPTDQFHRWCKSVVDDKVEPKERNMDGDTFSGFLIKMQDAITERANSLGPFREGRNWAASAFNTNSDPKTA